MDELTSPNQEGRLHHWLAIAAGHPPEWLAAYIQSPTASWVAVTEDGPEIARHRFTAFLEEANDLPYWAFALAKAYLDDVGEWPLFGIQAELALDAYLTHHDPILAVHEILAAVHTVWPEVSILYVGPELK